MVAVPRSKQGGTPMKRLLVIALVTLAAATTAPSGSAADKNVQSEIGQLKAQVNSLRGQVTTLKSQVKKLRETTTILDGEVYANFVGDVCLTAITADAFAATWRMTDQLAQQTGHGALFGPQTAIDDKTACSRLRPN